MLISIHILKDNLIFGYNNASIISKLNKKESYIDHLFFKKIAEKLDNKEYPITLKLKFTINGFIREIFTQNNWEKAYNKQDNIFRVVIKLEIKNNGHVMSQGNY